MKNKNSYQQIDNTSSNRIESTARLILDTYGGHAPLNNPFFIATLLEEITSFHPEITDAQRTEVRIKLISKELPIGR